MNNLYKVFCSSRGGLCLTEGNSRCKTFWWSATNFDVVLSKNSREEFREAFKDKTANADCGAEGAKDSKNVRTNSSGLGIDLFLCSCTNLEINLEITVSVFFTFIYSTHITSRKLVIN